MSSHLDPGACTVTVNRAIHTIQLHHGKEKDKQLSFRDVIALLPVSTPSPSLSPQYTLLYIHEPRTGERNTTENETSVTAESRIVVDPPKVLLDKFAISSLPTHLSRHKDSNGDCNLHVVVSVKAGVSEAEVFFDNVVRVAFEALGLPAHDYRVHSTTSERSVKDFASNVLGPRARSGVAQTVLLLSGDGGLVDIINIIEAYRSSEFVNPVIGLLALGTGNALANSTGLNLDATRGLGSFLRGTPHVLPTFVANFSPGSMLLTDEGRHSEPLAPQEDACGVLSGAVVCSWALHASLVADSDTTEYRKFGRERFQMAVKELLDPSDGSKPHVYQGRISLFKKNENGQGYAEHLDRTRHMYVLATLVSNLEERVKISPRSKPLDGQLRLIHFGGLPPGEVMRILGMAFAGGGHVKDEEVGYDTIEGMRIDFDEEDAHWQRVCVDGTIIKVPIGGWVEVRREPHGVLDLVVEITPRE
ncbi:hypothetical protein MMC13_001187 [Lambiella insularis]|nr:hypothetical protein [Lambiella insularis]